MNEEHDVRIKESASAVVSPEENVSGPFAYVVFGIVVGLSIISSLLLGGIIGMALTMAAEAAKSEAPHSYTSLPRDLEDNGLEDLLREYTDGLGGTDNNPFDSSESSTSSGTCTVAEALDFDLAPYSLSLQSEVSASAYAGTPTEVHAFVRDVLATDDEYATKVAQCLNAAARDESARTDQIKEAITLCDDASKAIDGKDIPAVEKDDNGSVKDALGSAKTLATKRWTAVKHELELLAEGADIDKGKLWDLDEEAVTAAEKAADQFEDAMEKAANASE